MKEKNLSIMKQGLSDEREREGRKNLSLPTASLLAFTFSSVHTGLSSDG